MLLLPLRLHRCKFNFTISSLLSAQVTPVQVLGELSIFTSIPHSFKISQRVSANDLRPVAKCKSKTNVTTKNYHKKFAERQIIL